ncbi:hypothetical protein T265_00340 [Opisthorchis viverrini]|uniref:Uncharacterized protein n=1 Tax=Opisthorchis viverrini TaxID=6198 RepID=A0A075A6B7_OPIVI|nr:hypothetical protein T265_00340 [Opisthorchis viverrini]KER33897.1 hypothetical protein T265_00340 [Opisthorchis viverrini]
MILMKTRAAHLPGCLDEMASRWSGFTLELKLEALFPKSPTLKNTVRVENFEDAADVTVNRFIYI